MFFSKLAIFELAQVGCGSGNRTSHELAQVPYYTTYLELAQVGCQTWNRTKIHSFKGCCPTFRRSGNVVRAISYDCSIIADFLKNLNRAHSDRFVSKCSRWFTPLAKRRKR